MLIDRIKENFQQTREVLGRFISDPETWEKIEKAGELMAGALKSGHKIISCGNGGSMCDAIHFAEELTGRFREDRRPFPAMALSDPAGITCTANDFGFENIFSRPVEALGKPDDVLLAISTSGDSKNVVKAIVTARRIGMKVIGLTGNTGGQMAGICDVEIRAPHTGYADRIQEIHTMVIHSLINYLELSLLTD
jgi:D-sedoheptulose 7-phosphate isomerase